MDVGTVPGLPRRALLLAACACLLCHGGGLRGVDDAEPDVRAPPDWLGGIAQGEILYWAEGAEGEARTTTKVMYPAIGNGYVATQINANIMYISGIYSGRATETPSHRAALPFPLSLSLSPAYDTGGVAPVMSEALHVKPAVFTRRSLLPPYEEAQFGHAPCGSGRTCLRTAQAQVIEQRLYAHRLLRSVMVHELVVLGSEAQAGGIGPSIYVERRREAVTDGMLNDAVAVLKMNRVMDASSPDVDLEDVTEELLSRAEYVHLRGDYNVLYGRTKEAEMDGMPTQHVLIMYSSLPADGSYIMRHAGDVQTDIIVVKTDLDIPVSDPPPASTAVDAIADVDLVTVLTGIPHPRVSGRRMDVKTALMEAAARDVRAVDVLRKANMLLLSHTAAWMGTPAKGALDASMFGFSERWEDFVQSGLLHKAIDAINDAVRAAQGTNKQVQIKLDRDMGDYARALLASLLPEPLWLKGVKLSEENPSDRSSIVLSSQYSLLSFLREDWPFGSSPGGLSTNGYNGHQFWDYDTFSAPVIDLFHGPIAASVLRYRSQRLPGGRQKALSYKPPYAGAMIPWESAFTGVEVCPLWAPTGTSEIHISGDVAISFWQHWLVTKDEAWLAREAFPVVADIADFWLSRALADSQPAAFKNYETDVLAPGDATPDRVKELLNGDAVDASAWCPTSSYLCRFVRDVVLSPVDTTPLHIRKVIPPTEFYQGVTDSVYTNAVAKLSLYIAARVGSLVGMPPVVTSPWLSAAHLLHIPYEEGAAAPPRPILSAGVHPSFAGYQWKEQVQLLDPAMLWWPLGLAGHSLSQEAHVDPDVFINDLVHYITHQEPTGSVAFSWAVNAIMFGEAGDANMMDPSFTRSYENFVTGPFKVWMEGSGGWGCPNFVTGAGGFLEAIVFGHARLRVLETGELTLRPMLVHGSHSIELRGVQLQAVALHIEYNASHLCVRHYSPHYDGRRDAVHAWRPKASHPSIGSTSSSPPAPWWREEGVQWDRDPRSPWTKVEDAFAARPWLAVQRLQRAHDMQAALSSQGSSVGVAAGVEVVVEDQDGVQHVLRNGGGWDAGTCLPIQAATRMTSMDDAAEEFQSVVHPTVMKPFLVRVQPKTHNVK